MCAEHTGYTSTSLSCLCISTPLRGQINPISTPSPPLFAPVSLHSPPRCSSLLNAHHASKPPQQHVHAAHRSSHDAQCSGCGGHPVPGGGSSGRGRRLLWLEHRPRHAREWLLVWLWLVGMHVLDAWLAVAAAESRSREAVGCGRRRPDTTPCRRLFVLAAAHNSLQKTV